MKARKIQGSAIMHAPPHIREIWDLFLCKACHSDNKYLQRGQLRITYNDIREDLHWMVGWRKMRYSKWDCEKALKWLKKATMITTRKTTLGMVVTICNYDFYQNPANYESHTYIPPPKATRKPQTTDTIYKKAKNVNKYISQFDECRKIFPGTKRGVETEFDNFRKHSDWEMVLPLLLPAVKEQVAKRAAAPNGAFVPLWKNFKTWINQRCWEEITVFEKAGDVQAEPAICVVDRKPATKYQTDRNDKKVYLCDECLVGWKAFERTGGWGWGKLSPTTIERNVLEGKAKGARK